MWPFGRKAGLLLDDQMRITRTERIAEAAATINEDVATICDSAAWVLDASSGLTGRNYTGSATDGVWFVTAWDAFLRRNVGRLDLPLSSLMAQGLAEVTAQYSQVTGAKEIDPVDRPSCAVAVVRFNPGSWDYFVLGDCSVIVAQMGIPTKILSDRRVADFDRQVIDEMAAALKDTNCHYREAHEKVRPRLQANRRRKNSLSGYWILEFSADALTHAVTGRIENSAAGEMLLMTDGFAQIWDTFQLETSPENLLARASRSGLADAYAQLKAEAAKDADCRRYPRIKPLDDAAAVLIQFQ